MNLYPKIEGRSLHTTSLFFKLPNSQSTKESNFQIVLMAVWARKTVLSPQGTYQALEKEKLNHKYHTPVVSQKD